MCASRVRPNTSSSRPRATATASSRNPPARTRAPASEPSLLALDAAGVARLDALLHAVNPEAIPLDAHRVAALTRWLLALPPEHARRELHQRLARLRELRRLAGDRDWDIDDAQRERAQRLLEFVAAPEGHLPDRVPSLGRLDDALVVELAWPAFADEVEDYLDFCRFRHEQHPRGAAPLTRSAWIALRHEDGALWQQARSLAHARIAELGGDRELRAR
jgi:hypothetical protein